MRSNDRCVETGEAGKEQTTHRATGDRCRLLRNSSASLSRSTQRRQTYRHVIRISTVQLRLTSVWVKNNQNNQIQSITLCNIYFSKKVYALYNGVWGKAPEAGKFSRIFVSKVTLQPVRLYTFNCKLRKNGGACRIY